MASKEITFDPTAGVPVASNLTIYGGADFAAKYTVTGTNGTAFDFSGAGISTWTGSAQMQKGVGIGATTVPAGTFTVGFTSAAGGVFQISMGSNTTRTLKEGRYLYNVIVSSGSTYYNIVNGNIQVYAGIASAPS